MFRLNEAETRSLLRQPESGMGYQFVRAVRRDYTREDGIAYNAELLALGDEIDSKVFFLPYQSVLKLAQSSENEIRSLEVITRTEATKSLSAAIRTAAAGAGAAGAPIEKTKADEVFMRFCAYENDRRVTDDRRLRPESYATTEQDAKNVKTGKDAVRRYALPNPEPASYRFTIRPKKDTDVQRGRVPPANNQPGGGVEVFFRNGTDAYSVTVPPTKLPDD